jgi:coenzyme PQQ precursor peptide PqqA
MRYGIADPCRCRLGACATERRLLMQWQTPTATDFRFGFEITLYVAAR